MTRQQGDSTIGRMVNERRLQRVPASREQADRLIAAARSHLISARQVCGDDPDGGYALVYDAARKALTAVLETQGLRPTSRGGHVVVYQAVRAQFDPPHGAELRPFDRMRRQRNIVEYLSTEAPPLTPADVREDIAKAAVLVDLAARLLDRLSPA